MGECVKCGSPEKYGRDCAPCARARSRRWYATNRERKLAQNTEWYVRNPIKGAVIKNRHQIKRLRGVL